MSKIQLSVIIPVFNTEKYLPKAIESVLKTSLDSIEIIIVDDASSGNCKQIAQKYKQKHNFIRYFKHDKNRGLFEARKTGILAAKGEYIAHLDPDDWIVNDIYYKAYQKAIKENSKIVCFNAMRIDTNNKKWIEEENVLPLFINKDGKFLLEETLFSLSLAWIWHTNWNKIIKKDILLEAIFDFEYKNHIVMCEDMLYSFLLYTYCYSQPIFSSMEEVGLYYLRHSGGITYKKSSRECRKKLNDTFYILKNINSILKHYNLDKKYKKSFLHLQYFLLSKSFNDFKKYDFDIWLYIKYFLKTSPYHLLFSIKRQARKIVKKCQEKNINKVAIFGTGYFASKIKNELEKKDIEVMFFIKSELSKDEKYFKDLPIKKLSHIENDCLYPVCIASMDSYYLIKKLLQKTLSTNVCIIHI